MVEWEDYRNGNDADVYNNAAVCGRDLAGGQEFPIATSPVAEAYPDCDGNRVVYMSTRATTRADISMLDRTTGATTTVSAQPWNEWQPPISGNRVVWQGWPSQRQLCATIQIFGVDLSTGAPITVANGSGNQITPDVSGTIVVLGRRPHHQPRSLVPRARQRDEAPVVDTGGDAPPEVADPGLRTDRRRQQQINGSWDIDMKNL
jgi:hypothetical protein